MHVCDAVTCGCPFASPNLEISNGAKWSTEVLGCDEEVSRIWGKTLDAPGMTLVESVECRGCIGNDSRVPHEEVSPLQCVHLLLDFLTRSPKFNEAANAALATSNTSIAPDLSHTFRLTIRASPRVTFVRAVRACTCKEQLISLKNISFHNQLFGVKASYGFVERYRVYTASLHGQQKLNDVPHREAKALWSQSDLRTVARMLTKRRSSGACWVLREKADCRRTSL